MDSVVFLETKLDDGTIHLSNMRRVDYIEFRDGLATFRYPTGTKVIRLTLEEFIDAAEE